MVIYIHTHKMHNIVHYTCTQPIPQLTPRYVKMHCAVGPYLYTAVVHTEIICVL